MSSVETEILATLRELQRAAVGPRTGQDRPNLLDIFARLEDLTRQLPKDSDPNLLHYLHRKSYEKARLWLEERQAENRQGNCPAP